MTERDQLRRVCQWNRQLAQENALLSEQLENARKEGRAQEAANAALRLVAEAADAFLGAAMDEAIKAVEAT